MSAEKHKAGSPANQGDNFLDGKSSKDNGNWTAQQAKDYAEWLEEKKREVPAEPKHVKNITRKRKTDVEVAAYGDTVSALVNAVQFAEIALEQDRLFDDVGFLHTAEVFLEHARNVSTHLKKIRKAREDHNPKS